jgi:hypothetical protein
MAEELPQGLVKVQVLELPGYVKGVVTRLAERDVQVLEKKGAVRRLGEDENPKRSDLGKADKKAAPGNKKA